MSVLIALFSLLNPDPCKIGGLMGNEDRSLALVYADPDRDVCPVLVDGGPTWTWGDGGG